MRTASIQNHSLRNTPSTRLKLTTMVRRPTATGGISFHSRRVPETGNSAGKGMVNRLEDIKKLPEKERDKIFDYIDLVIRDVKIKKAHAS